MTRKQVPYLKPVESNYGLGRISLEEAIEHAVAQIEGELDDTLVTLFPSLRDEPDTCDFNCQPSVDAKPLVTEDVAPLPVPTFEEQVAALRGIRHTYVLLMPRGATRPLLRDPNVSYVHENTMITTHDGTPLFVYHCQNPLNRRLDLSFPQPEVEGVLREYGGIPKAGVDVIFVSSTLTHTSKIRPTTIQCFPGVTSFGYLTPSGVENIGIIGAAYLNPRTVHEIREKIVIYDSR